MLILSVVNIALSEPDSVPDVEIEEVVKTVLEEFRALPDELPKLSELSEEQKTELWGLIYTQAQGMDSDSLCEYYADHEVDDVDLAEFERLKKEGQ